MNKDNAKDYLPLVQALSEGKVIQGRMAYSGRWEDMPEEFDFSGPAESYRIKPEPREYWSNRYSSGGEVYGYESEESAKNDADPGAIQVRYREVIE